MTSLMFISGAGLPAWVWDRTRERLGLGSTVAPRPTTAAGDVTDHAHAALAAAPSGPLAVVAHSAGGVVASEVLRLAPHRVQAYLAVSAVVPAAGRSFVSSLPFPGRLVLPLVLRLAGTRPPEKALRESLAAGVDPALTQRLIEDFVPESRAYFTSRVGPTSAVGACGYLVTIDDRELPRSVQEGYARRLGCGVTGELPGGHLPMLHSPDALADRIAAFLAAADLPSSAP